MALVDKERQESDPHLTPFEREAFNFRSMLHETIEKIDIPRRHPFTEDSNRAQNYMHAFSRTVVDIWHKDGYEPESAVMIHGLATFTCDSAAILLNQREKYAEKMLQLSLMIITKAELDRGIPPELLTTWDTLFRYYNHLIKRHEQTP